ncbi:MAG: site-specific integrase [Roseburia sp.]|nr:site-specific integrase [Roseburia sp.]
MAEAGRGKTRRDSKRRVLRPGESIRADGKYQYKYHIDGKPHFVYSWKLEPTDKLPPGKKPCLSLRELEKQVNSDLDRLLNITDGNMTVCELVDRYLKTKTGVRQSTRTGYVTVQRVLAKEPFGQKKIRSIKTSDAKLFLIKLQQEDGKSYSSIHNIRGVLRPAFQMAVDDDILVKNPFGFQLAGVVVNDSVTREAISREQMRKFLKFVHDDVVYCKYYEVVYILFHTGMRISEFCGLTLKDIDLEGRTVNIDHQLQRTCDMRYVIEETKTDAGKRKIPITEDVAQMFQAIIEDREPPKMEKVIDGYTGFLFYDDDGNPLVAMHWQHRFNRMVGRYNDIYRVQMPNITPHVCRHTYCSNMAKSGMNPKTLQYLMGHSDISVTMNVYTHISFDDAEEELKRMEEFRKAQAEIEKKNDVKAVSQKMFKVV